MPSWVTPGTYTECVAGYQIYTYCVAITIGGSGGIFTNGTIPTTNIAPRTNIPQHFTTGGGTTTINSTGGSCLHVTRKRYSSPFQRSAAHTCYDSLDFTWDDDNFNLIAGDGTGVATGATTTFQFGRLNTTANCISCVALGYQEDVSFQCPDGIAYW